MGVCSGDALAHHQVLGELLPLDAATVGSHDAESIVEQSGDGLQRVQLAVAVERKADDMLGVLVPGGSLARVHYRRANLRKDLLDEGALAADADAFAQFR